MILYANEGHSIEAVISNVKGATLHVSSSPSISARLASPTTLIITGKPGAITSVTTGDVNVIIATKEIALSFWNVRLPSQNHTQYDQAPDVPSALVFGPYLVRNATLEDSGTVLALNGDLNATATLDVIPPMTVTKVTWNGEPVQVQKSPLGTLQGTLEFDVQPPQLPSLRQAEWSCIDSLPEIQPGFDDSSWVTANKTTTARPYQPFAGKVCAGFLWFSKNV